MTRMQWRFWRGRGGAALVFGLGLTLVAALVHVLGIMEWAELWAYDAYVRHYSRVPAADEIVHVDIDDDSLERVGSWPWPRDVQAELIRVLGELGARQIVVDIVFNDAKAGELRVPELEPNAELVGPVAEIGEISPENLVFPDQELGGAIRAAGNVYLSMYYHEGQAEGLVVDPALARRAGELLRADFDLGRDELAAKLGVGAERVEAILAGAKRKVARERVGALLADRPETTAREAFERISKRPFAEESADRADVLWAYEREANLRALIARSPAVPAGLKGKLPPVDGEVIPPLAKLSRGAKQDAFVTFRPDGDGRMRRLPLLMEYHGRLLEQLAFAAARDRLGIELEDLSIDGRGDLRIAARGQRPAMRVPLTDDGRMLINWHVADEWWRCFQHVPVTRLLQVYACRQSRRENETGRQVRVGEVLRLMRGDEGFAAYRRKVNTLLEQERRVRRAELDGRGEEAEIKALRTQAGTLRRQVEAEQAETLAFVTEQWGELKAQTRPAEADAAKDYDRLASAAKLIEGDIAAYQKTNATIAAQEAELLRQLRPLIAGKACFVGYTATAVADMVSTPAYPRMPGVLVHSNVYNSFVQGQFRDWSPAWVQALAILLLGGLASVLTATRGPRQSLVLAAVLLALVGLANGTLLFERMDLWLRLVTAMVTMLAAWTAVVVVRYLTIERERRRFSRAVAQYVSPAMARQIASSTEDFDLAPAKGVVTCYFSDLEGFTRLSERLGPEGTRAVLNPYLEAMSAVLHRHNGLINKFMGDGIFAFFNSPILPCGAHERECCAGASESVRALEELKARHAQGALAEEFARLAMRIGVAAGPVFVGDYGSENKLDYTCMGDTVNLASRLEGANKAFGTGILVNAAARAAAGDEFAFRPMGLLQVKGQTVGVRVFELLGYAGQVSDECLRFRDLFESMVGAFAEREWEKALRGLGRCAELRPQDRGVQLYRVAIERFGKMPPGEAWNGAIELTEK